MNFPEFVAFALDRLENCGFSAYLVGGCVRDFIMEITPHDFDITTNATPDEILSCFADTKCLDIGKKHGTITLVFDKDCVEVTTYRIDGEYKDSRHPESVTFTDKIESDLARRDFTMNAIAYSPKRGFVDPFSGRLDIEKKRIVCVGNAHERFCEDALRIMRALRFSSRFGFEIENDTSNAVFNKKQLLLNIANERIRAELDGILDGKYCTDIIDKYFDVFRVFIPELVPAANDSLCECIGYESAVKLAVLFSGMQASVVNDVMKRLKYDTKTLKAVVTILENIKDAENCIDDISIKKLVSRIGADFAVNVFETLCCIFTDKKSDYSMSICSVKDFIKKNVCLSIKQLKVDGNDILKECGVKPQLVGGILSRLLDDVIEQKCLNERHSLIERAKSFTI